MRINQLWKKLALGLISIAVAAIIVTFLLINFVFDLRFQGYISDRERASYQRIGRSLAEAYIENGGWGDRLSDSLPHFSMMSGVAVEVVNADGQVVAETAADDQGGDSLMRSMAKVAGTDRLVEELLNERVEVPIVAHGERVGAVYITPLVKTGQLKEDKRFRQSINNSLIFGGLLAALAALGLSFVISTRMTRPLARIITAAKKMESGDLSQQVVVKGQDEISQLGEAFNHMAMALQRQERLRKNLTADVAHELRTPLATIRSHIEAYLDGVISPDEDNLKSIHEEILRLGRLVEDLGELAKAESGKLKLSKKRVDLSVLAERAVQGLKPLFEKRRIECDLKMNGEAPINCDEDRIKQVLVNLMVNAVKFTPVGGLVTVKVASDETTASISISDTGVGIDPGSQKYIFDRFYRVDKSRNRATGGSGIGLTIANELIKLHGGRIKVSSEIGSGSTFKITLPRFKNS